MDKIKRKAWLWTGHRTFPRAPQESRKTDLKKERKLIGLYSGGRKPRYSPRNGAVQFTDLKLAYSIHREKEQDTKKTKGVHTANGLYKDKAWVCGRQRGQKSDKMKQEVESHRQQKKEKFLKTNKFLRDKLRQIVRENFLTYLLHIVIVTGSLVSLVQSLSWNL